MAHSLPKVSRHKTAMKRVGLSRPIRLALDFGLILESATVLDYGCGLGGDVTQLTNRGIKCWGWDPAHKPEGSRASADVVNLGYVINVIEDVKERQHALSEAWSRSNGLLVVSARLSLEYGIDSHAEFSDGCLTKRNTFQKFYTQRELRDWIDSTLEVNSIPAAPGVFFIFRDVELQQRYLLSKFRRRKRIPIAQKSDVLYEENKELLDKLAAFVTSRGRTPEMSELSQSEELKIRLGSINRAFSVLQNVMGKEIWDRVRQERGDDLLVLFALDRFQRRVRFSELPLPIQLDVRSFFGTYTRACEAADDLLFAAGDMKKIDVACKDAVCGKLTNDALYIHREGLLALPALLRVFEGCARAYVGELEGTNIIKLHRRSAKVSYLSYPEFDRVAHPSLLGSLLVSLKDLETKYRRYADSKNPPILHRKELFVPEDYPEREKFALLTLQEEKCGLYENPRSIGFRQGWEHMLEAKGIQLFGHRISKMDDWTEPLSS